MSYTLPAFVNIREDGDSRTRTVSILDANDKKQNFSGNPETIAISLLMPKIANGKVIVRRNF